MGAYIVIVQLYFMVPYTYTAILGVILCCSLPLVMSFRSALACSILFSLPLWLIYELYWQRSNMLMTATLFWTFNLFALVMINAMIKAKEAHAHSQQINRELLATQSLLTEATKQSERVRIARNIHDLLGHHLTALTIKLQVAQRLSDGQAKQEIDECHQLAKLLLSDVREAVSEIRSKSQIDLITAIRSLQQNTPQLNIETDFPDSIQISDVQQADAVLRAIQESITNSLKHSKASTFAIAVQQTDNALLVHLKDNGKSISHTIKPGNGLIGIRERVSALNGTVDYQSTPDGFVTDIHLPLNREAA
jgi:signal transduction histidine kinase